MHIISNITKLRKTLNDARRRGQSIGFVPTMGALHAGHGSLLRQARKENDLVILSIFVNPKQFGKNEDFAKYPREKNKDCLFAKKENVDIMFYPSVKEIYPRSFLTSIKVAGVSEHLCGRFRPGHFDGVALVVAKLLNIVTPDTLYLGEKDAQQCVVIKRIVFDLNIPVNVKICPTVREKDGLAMSSRNQYLTPRERQEASVLYKALTQARVTIKKGEKNTARVIKQIASLIKTSSTSKIQYIECVDPETLTPVKKIDRPVLIALAVWFGNARLIDNIFVSFRK